MLKRQDIRFVLRVVGQKYVQQNKDVPFRSVGP